MSTPLTLQDADLREVLAALLQVNVRDVEPTSDCTFDVLLRETMKNNHRIPDHILQYTLYDATDKDERRAHKDDGDIIGDYHLILRKI